MKVELYAKAAILLLFVLCMFISSSFAQENITRLKQGVVKIEATTFDEKRKVGTGFIARLEQDAVYIVTASHVVEGASEINVEFFTRRNRRIPAEVINMEGGDPQGLALLLVGENIPSGLLALKLTSSISVGGGESVTTIGFPRISGVPWAVIKGDIVGRKGKTITFSGAVDEGNSGGPLMKDGQVIGVVTEVTEKFAYAIPTIIVQYVLEGWGVEFEEGIPQPAATPTPRPTAPPTPIPTATPTSLPTPPVVEQKSHHDSVSGIDFVWVPEDCFRMGSPESEEKRDSDEGPVHEVCLDGFWMGKYEVTQAQWEQVMGSNPSGFKGNSRPVERVSWNDAQEFLKKLNVKAGKEIYRLPTEAEWEYAARAGTTTPFYFGATISTDVANYDGNYTYGSGSKGIYREQTTEVGSFPPNDWGLYDMHGNVWEWCQDWYESGYYSKSPSKNPQGPSSGTYRVLRGGSWYNFPYSCRSAYRFWCDPDSRVNNSGFRVVVGSVAWTR